MDHTQPYTPAPVVLTTTDGQPLYLTPPAIAPLTVYRPAPVAHLTAYQLPIAPGPATVSVPAPEPVAVRDPWPARLLAGGVGLGAAALGAGFLLKAIAEATTGLALLAAVLALVWLLKTSGSGGRGSVNVTVTTHNRNR